MRNRLIGLVAMSGAIVLVTAACSVRTVQDDPVVLPGVQAAEVGEPEDAALPEGVDRAVDVELSDFAITADSFEFVPGETVRFNVTNGGVVEHEFRLSNQERVDERARGGQGAEFDGEDAILLLDAGESGSMTFTFPDNADEYTAAVCLVPGHYEAGMATDLTFTS